MIYQITNRALCAFTGVMIPKHSRMRKTEVALLCGVRGVSNPVNIIGISSTIGDCPKMQSRFDSTSEYLETTEYSLKLSLEGVSAIGWQWLASCQTSYHALRKTETVS